MKKTFVITAGILFIFACIGLVLSAFLTESWQHPVEDETNLIINPPVEEILEDKVKAYKYHEVTKEEYLERYPDGEYVEYENDMITAAEAAAYAGTILDKARPDVDWCEVEFDLIRADLYVSYNDQRQISAYHGEKRDEIHRTTYTVDRYTGDVLRFTSYPVGEDIFEMFNRNKKQVEKHVEDPFGEMYKMISAQLQAAQQMGYAEIKGICLPDNYNPEMQYSHYTTTVITEDDEVLSIYIDNGQIVEFMDFTKYRKIKATDKINSIGYLPIEDFSEVNLKNVLLEIMSGNQFIKMEYK